MPLNALFPLNYHYIPVDTVGYVNRWEELKITIKQHKLHRMKFKIIGPADCEEKFIQSRFRDRHIAGDVEMCGSLLASLPNITTWVIILQL